VPPTQKYLEYVERNQLHQRDLRPYPDDPTKSTPTPNLSFMLGLQIRSRDDPARSHRKQPPKEQPTNELPFSIKLSHKRRVPIVERLNESPPSGVLKGAGEKEASAEGKNEMEVNISSKISQGVEVTPESKFQQF
jgi:hypothetical protein